MTEVGDTGLVFGVGSVFSTFSVVTRPIVNDKVILYTLGSGQQLAVPTLAFHLDDQAWVIPTFPFAGFDWKLDVNLQLIPLVTGWLDDGITPYLWWEDVVLDDYYSWGAYDTAIVEPSGATPGAKISTWYVTYPPDHPPRIYFYMNVLMRYADRHARYMDFDLAVSTTYFPGGASFFELSGKAVVGGLSHATHVHEPATGHYRLDLTCECNTLRMAGFAWMEVSGTEVVTFNMSNVVFSS